MGFHELFRGRSYLPPREEGSLATSTIVLMAVQRRNDNCRVAGSLDILFLGPGWLSMGGGEEGGSALNGGKGQTEGLPLPNLSAPPCQTSMTTAAASLQGIALSPSLETRPWMEEGLSAQVEALEEENARLRGHLDKLFATNRTLQDDNGALATRLKQLQREAKEPPVKPEGLGGE